MPSILGRIAAAVSRCAEALVTALLGIMFAAFVIQIIFRYFFNFPIGWTSELTVIAWLYMVLLGSAFWLKEDEHIRFDVVSGFFGIWGRRVIGGVVALGACLIFLYAMPATWKYVSFMKVESTSYMKIRLDILYSVYVLFAIGVIARYGWLTFSRLRGDEDNVELKATSGL